MPETLQHDPALVPTHTIAATSSIAHWVAQHHGIPVQQCHLPRWPHPGLPAGPPELGPELLETYRRLVHSLLEALAAAEGGFTRVVCHGDTHSFNNHVNTD